MARQRMTIAIEEELAQVQATLATGEAQLADLEPKLAAAEARRQVIQARYDSVNQAWFEAGQAVRDARIRNQSLDIDSFNPAERVAAERARRHYQALKGEREEIERLVAAPRREALTLANQISTTRNRVRYLRDREEQLATELVAATAREEAQRPGSQPWLQALARRVSAA